MSLKDMIYKKCSSYSILCLKISQTSEFYKNTKDSGNLVNLSNEKITDFENVVFYSEYFFYIILKPFNQLSIAKQVVI